MSREYFSLLWRNELENVICRSMKKIWLHSRSQCMWCNENRLYVPEKHKAHS